MCRWHLDGPYFTASTGPLKPRHRYGCVLVGQPTVFLRSCFPDVMQWVTNTQLADRAEVKIGDLYEPSAWSRIVSRNEQLHHAIGENPTVWAAHQGVGSKWRADFTGDVHSEPLDESNRVFIAVLSGTQEDIMAYRDTVHGRPLQVSQVRFN